jgi:hypothetical protein
VIVLFQVVCGWILRIIPGDLMKAEKEFAIMKTEKAQRENFHKIIELADLRTCAEIVPGLFPYKPDEQSRS